jgi:hypothetical protein
MRYKIAEAPRLCSTMTEDTAHPPARNGSCLATAAPFIDTEQQSSYITCVTHVLQGYLQQCVLSYQVSKYTSNLLRKFNVIHIPCNRMIIWYSIQQTAHSIINNIWHCPSYKFVLARGHYQGSIQTGIQIQHILNDGLFLPT